MKKILVSLTILLQALEGNLDKLRIERNENMLYVWGNGKNTTLLSLEQRVQQNGWR